MLRNYIDGQRFGHHFLRDKNRKLWQYESMNPILSNDLEQLVSHNPTGAVKVVGPSGKSYWVMNDDAMVLHIQIQEGLDDANRGNVAPWNSEEIIEKGRRLRDNRPA